RRRRAYRIAQRDNRAAAWTARPARAWVRGRYRRARRRRLPRRPPESRTGQVAERARGPGQGTKGVFVMVRGHSDELSWVAFCRAEGAVVKCAHLGFSRTGI